jgi:thiamine-phosphate pyrophosphorylase
VILSGLYTIVDAVTLARRGVKVAEFARELRDADVTLLQYRDKVGGPQEILRAASEIARVFEGVGATLILNDRADLAALLGWGVHVGQADLLPEDAKAVARGAIPHAPAPASKSARRGPRPFAKDATGRATRIRGDAVVGVSTHNEEQVVEAERGVADYVAVGPVFGTATKLDAEPMVGLEGVRRARSLTRKPLVAIGGITLENARSVVDAGADSVAVIGGLFVPGRTVGEVARDFLEILR